MNDFLKGCNASQREAICHSDGPALVLAGPGSGKTTVLTKRLQYLITTLHIPPQEILVVTFTKAAALEMQQRFYHLVGEKSPVCFGTFHSIFYRILKEHQNHFSDHSNQNSLSILTEKEKTTFMRQILRREQITEEFVSAFLEQFKVIKGGSSDKNTENSMSKNMEKNLSDLLESTEWWKEGLPEEMTLQRFLHIFECYRKKCKESGKLDFDDMAYECLQLFQSRPDVLRKWQKRFRYILVDEYQDIAPIQEQLLFLLAFPENNLFLVGDDDQAIYGFRGAGTESMLTFPKEYPDTKQIFLAMNYRSRPEIIEAAGKVISVNKKRFVKKQQAARESTDEERVICQGFAGEMEEYEEILRCLKEMEKEETLEQCAVLYRKNKDAEKLIRLLEQHRIAYAYIGKRKSLREHFITEDITAYLRFLSGNRSRKNFYRIMNRPERGIERESCKWETVSFLELKKWHGYDREILEHIQKMEDACERVKGFLLYAVVMYIRKGLGYEAWLRKNVGEESWKKHLDILQQLQELTRGMESLKDWERWLEKEEKASGEKQGRSQNIDKGVRIMTYHGSKGLEFDSVIMPDLNEGSVPHKKAATEEEMEEERRMFYVGMTRAKEKLYLYYRTGTEKEPETMSRFLHVLRNENENQSSSSTSSSNSASSRYSSKASATISYSSSSSI